MSTLEWNTLAPGALVLDRIPYRAVTLFGRSTRSSPTSGPVDFSTYPEWNALITDPNPGKVALAGSRYIYLDNTWWDQLNSGQKDNSHPGLRTNRSRDWRYGIHKLAKFVGCLRVQVIR